MRGLHQPVEVGERPEDRIHGRVIGHVVAEVLHRRRKNRREPERVDAQPAQVIQARENPRQIADAVAVAVHERARIDLVHDAALPPEVVHAEI